MKRLVILISVCLAVLYPLFIHLGIDHVSPRLLALLLLAVVAIRALIALRSRGLNLKAFLPFVLIGVASALTVLLSDNARVLLHIPTLVNAGLCLVFLRSYFHPPTMIEHFARLEFPVMPANAIDYCRRVTLVWAASFLLCTAICFYLAQFGPRRLWLIWSSIGIYAYHGLVFGTEYLVRRRQVPKFEAAIAAMGNVEASC